MNDKTDAGVSGATVVIRNLETGTERTLTTVVSGHYNASALPVGHYEIAVSKAGFQTARRSSLNLVVGQREEVDFKLQVGQVHQTVEVPEVSSVVQITTEDDSGVVGERQVKDLPLNGRSYDQLLTLNPGIINYASSNVGRNTLQSPSLVLTDILAAKKFLLSERLHLQFRAEIFNLINHTNFNTPNPVVYAVPTGGPSPTAGIITSTATTPQQVVVKRR